MLAQGIRVEVNGQVLSQGGDVAADQVTDTTSALPVRQNPEFLPSAIIVGLDPGVPLEVRLRASLAFNCITLAVPPAPHEVASHCQARAEARLNATRKFCPDLTDQTAP